MIFHDHQLSSMTFQAWKLKYLDPMKLQGFDEPREPWQSERVGFAELKTASGSSNPVLEAVQCCQK